MRMFLRASLLLLALGVSSAFGVQIAEAQGTPRPVTPTLPIPGATAGHENPVGEPFTDDAGRSCQQYRYDGKIITECKTAGSGETESCYSTYVAGGQFGGSTDVRHCETFDSTGRLIRVNGRATSIAGTGTSETDAETGERTQTFTAGMGGEWKCTQGNLPRCFANLPGMLFTGIAFLILTLSGFILGLAGTVFNWVVIRTVFQFGEYFGTNEGMLIAWGVMRDVANIGLLFGFILMGVLLILNVEGGGGHGHGGGMSAKKAIPRLIIFAVLLNFSLFASQLVIDVANAFSSSFATLAGESCSTNTSTGTTADNTAQGNQDCANVGIAGQVLKVTGLTALWDTEALDIETGMKNLADRPYSYAVSLIMLSIFVLVTAMVLLAGAIMLVIRVVVLSLLMVTSPIGFAGMAIPKLQSIASMWWSKLMSQAFFAPVYLLLIFISIKLTEGLTEGNATLANALIANQGNSVAGNMQVVMVFLVVIGFMIGSLIAASKMGAMGAKFATSAAAGMTVGAVGFAGRRTFGRLSTAAATRIRGSSLGETGFGKQLAGVADYGSKASFSLRNVSSGGLGKLGVDIGKANKTASHGYHGIEEKAIKERVEYAKGLKSARGETDGEMQERINAENQAIEAQRLAAQESVAGAELKVAAVTEARTKAAAEQATQKQHLTNREYSLGAQRAYVAKNPQDEAAQTQLIQEERLLAKEQQELARADQALSEADKALAQAREEVASARENEAAAMSATADTSRAQISAKQRQLNFADNIAHQGTLKYRGIPGIGGHNITLAGHANHEAAEKIRTNANKTKLEKALDDIKEAAEKTETEKTEDHSTPAKDTGAPHH
jgi:hypothetical protein